MSIREEVKVLDEAGQIQYMIKVRHFVEVRGFLDAQGEERERLPSFETPDGEHLNQVGNELVSLDEMQRYRIIED